MYPWRSFANFFFIYDYPFTLSQNKNIDRDSQFSLIVQTLYAGADLGFFLRGADFQKVFEHFYDLFLG